MKKTLKTTFNTRQYMLSKDFELYYYDDTHFPDVKAHTHDYYEFYFFLQGAITMHIGNRAFSLKEGDVVLIPPGLSHRTVNNDDSVPYRRFIFWLSSNFYKQLCALAPEYDYAASYARETGKYVYHNDTVAFNMIQAMIFRLLGEIHSERFGHSAKIALDIHNLILNLNRMAYEQNVPGQLQQKHNLYEKLMIYIESHLEEDLSLEHLAEIFYVNKYHISHIFRENLGISIHQYIIKRRLTMCRDALLNNSSISNTYLLYGFKDYSSFYRAFKKEYGVSPKEYKQSSRNEELKHLSV